MAIRPPPRRRNFEEEDKGEMDKGYKPVDNNRNIFSLFAERFSYRSGVVPTAATVCRGSTCSIWLRCYRSVDLPPSATER